MLRFATVPATHLGASLELKMGPELVALGGHAQARDAIAELLIAHCSRPALLGGYSLGIEVPNRVTDVSLRQAWVMVRVEIGAQLVMAPSATDLSLTSGAFPARQNCQRRG